MTLIGKLCNSFSDLCNSYVKFFLETNFMAFSAIFSGFVVPYTYCWLWFALYPGSMMSWFGHIGFGTWAAFTGIPTMLLVPAALFSANKRHLTEEQLISQREHEAQLFSWKFWVGLLVSGFLIGCVGFVSWMMHGMLIYFIFGDNMLSLVINQHHPASLAFTLLSFLGVLVLLGIFEYAGSRGGLIKFNLFGAFLGKKTEEVK